MWHKITIYSLLLLALLACCSNVLPTLPLTDSQESGGMMQINNPETNSFLRMVDGTLLYFCTEEVSGWDMDADMLKNHTPVNLPAGATIHSMSCTIYADMGDSRTLPYIDPTSGVLEACLMVKYTGGNFQFWRRTAGFFDNATYNDVGVVRVRVLIGYTP